jgi:nitrite reductase/ring-hydroxylating ferredoxin subunit
VARRFPFPIPNGWFAVAWSDELTAGDVKPLFYLDRQLVLFRTVRGDARLFDAYCPHLGAHLGHGGKVVGETLQCPFHGWRYDGSGQCVEVPYAKKIPARARVEAYRVVERYGLVFAWHHLEDEPPFYEIPELPELEDPAWIPPVHRDWKVETAIQEMAENDHDNAHFPVVHGGEYLPTQVSYQGLTKIAVSPTARTLPDGRKQETELVRKNYGLGLATVETRGVPGAGFFMLSSVTPIDAERVHMRWALTVTKNVADSMGDAFIQGLSEGMGVTADIPIWEHKRYLARPVLCDGDGPIAEFRRWARQFYSKLDPEPA